MRSRVIAVAVPVLCSAVMAMGALAETPTPLAVRVLIGPGQVPHCSGHWAVQTDRKGRAFLFCGDQLSVRALGDKGHLGDPLPLLTTSGVAAGPVRGAAMSLDGNSWLVLSPLPHLFRNGREVPLAEMQSWPESGAFLGDVPVVSPVPIGLGASPERTRSFFDDGSAPLLLKPGKEGWEALLTAPARQVKAANAFTNAVTSTASVACGFADGGGAVASRYLYLVRLLDTHAKISTTITRRSAKPVLTSEEDASAGLERAATHHGFDMKAAKGEGFAARPVVLGIAARRDGVVYYLVSPAAAGTDKPALDRFDPATAHVERVFLNLDFAGHATMACGTKGLFVATFAADHGRIWFVSWSDLDSASWEPVADAEVTGAASATAN